MIFAPERIIATRKTAFGLSLGVAVLGMLVLVGWAFDLGWLKSVFPGLATMKANTALSMLLSGAALAILSQERMAGPLRLATVGLAWMVVGISALTLGEYLFGWELGIDQWLFRDASGTVGTSHPGRMSASTAFCFVLMGGALLAAAQPLRMRLRVPVMAALGMTVVMVGGLALMGYVSEELFGFRWWNYTGVAVHTATGFLLLGLALLAFVKSEGGLAWMLDRNITAGFVMAMVVMLMATAVTSNLISKMVDASTWVSHTQEVLKEIKEIAAGLADLESGQRGYIITGDEGILARREQTKAAVRRDMADIRQLTIDNPSQQHRLDQLEPLLVQRTDFGDQTIVARRQQGFAIAGQMIVTDTGIGLSGKILQLLQAMETAEYALLDKRQMESTRASIAAFLVLPLGVFLSLALLSLGLFFLNAGVGERKQAEEALRKSEAQLQTVVENLDEGVAISDLTGQLLHFNRAALDMLGFASLDEIRRPLHKFADIFELRNMDGSVSPLDQWPLARILHGEKLHDLEMSIRHKQSGWERVFSYGGTLVHDAAGQPLMAVVTIRDITERKRAEAEIRALNAGLERRVLERTAQLEVANEELEAFSYSVSHDLRAPLRAVDGFSQAVVEDYGPLLPEEGRRFLRTIRDGAQRMGALIDDLLAFSRLSRQAVSKDHVNIGLMVREVLEGLNPRQQGRQVEVRVGELPPCQGDAALLRQVWINLLSNAFKYTRKREIAVVEIGCKREQGEDVYFVRDNGTGFDMQYADKLFGVFQRLHRAEDYEGTGVGLAIVQRIIHRHGGRIWAEAVVDRGATFYFTLKGETKP